MNAAPHTPAPGHGLSVAVVGAGWAGLAAAVTAARQGAQVTVFEATREPGGRARALDVAGPAGPLRLDNGQHILIGAYATTLDLMEQVGLEPHRELLALPLGMPHADGTGLTTPAWAAGWPAPAALLAAVLCGTRGWTWAERLGLLRTSLRWQRQGFVCAAHLSVADVSVGLPKRAMDELIGPLCVSALNVPPGQASAAVFLRVLRDALFGPGHGGWAASQLLLPRTDLGALWPDAALRWLATEAPVPAVVHRACRVQAVQRVQQVQRQGGGWSLAAATPDGTRSAVFDRVIWATQPTVAAAALAEVNPGWATTCGQLQHTAITTVYLHAAGQRLPSPMLALRSAPAQFVFDRGWLRPDDVQAQGVLAFVISASQGERDALQQAVLQQARDELGLPVGVLQPLQTVTEKRATFACTPGVQRPGQAVAPGLWAAGDYTEGPYPATLEAAVRSGVAAAQAALGR
ncbi:hydroxysqualene dehydroxylase HpnE [Hydrogenophaga sp. R2]|uniref:hydroxysqualene dehydroxylase HpnE n=1 Tax=Hydrogenophaga sp. R2 TaxID=3132827 RepID=UPI003CE86816